jgi:hypothetical protein
LLWVAHKSAGASRLLPQPLNRRRNITRLLDVSLPQRYRPVRLITHLVKHIWIVRQRLYRHVPWLVVYAGSVVAIRSNPPGGLLDLVHEARRGQHLGQQRIGIQGDRGQQVIQLVCRVGVLR